MSDKSTSVNFSNLLDNKISVLLESMVENISEENMSEKERILAEYHRVSRDFIKTLYEPLFKTPELRATDTPNFKKINDFFRVIHKDIKILYKEIQDLSSNLTNGYNNIVNLSESMRSKLKRVRSQMADYKIYAEESMKALYYNEDYASLDNVESDSEMYTESLCSVDTSSGELFLPVDKTKTKQVEISSISIGDLSNGYRGNNDEIGSVSQPNLEAIYDSSFDTWFEYEAVSAKPSSTPLILELKIDLGTTSIFNKIDIATTTFLSKKYAEITRIDSSIDGKVFDSILPELTENSSLKLSPSDSGGSEKRTLRFVPRRGRYLYIVFQQKDSYIITTPLGQRNRKAIGLREITITSEAYKEKGETISTNYLPGDEVKKVGLKVYSRNNGVNTTVETSISPDNGSNWNEISDLSSTSSSSPEILNLNVDTEDSSIKTDTPVSGIRTKIVLTREKFNNNTQISNANIRTKKTELKTYSPTSDSITLEETPVAGSVKVYNTSFGSVGKGDGYIIGVNELEAAESRYYHKLPIIPFYSECFIRGTESVFVSGELWTRVEDLSSSSSSNKHYEYDYINNIIYFGNDINGKKPYGNISIKNPREKLLFENSSSISTSLRFDSDSIKSNISLYRIKNEEKNIDVILGKNARVHRLEQKEISSIVEITETGTLAREMFFYNGNEELIQEGDYSIDKENGYLYTYSQTLSSVDTTINVTYQDRVEISPLTVDGNIIKINSEDYVTEESSCNITFDGLYGELPNNYIEKKSIRFLNNSNLFSKEIAYVNGSSEFTKDLRAEYPTGLYSVDYVNGRIYITSSISESVYIQYRYTNFVCSYNVCSKIPEASYSLSNNIVKFSPEKVLSNFFQSLEKTETRPLLKIDYEYILEVEENDMELEPYYTPVIDGYTLSIITSSML